MVLELGNRLGGIIDIVGRKAELLGEDLIRRGSAEVIHRHEARRLVVDAETIPAEAGTGLDDNTLFHKLGNNALAVDALLGKEKLHRRHRNDADGLTLAGETLGRLDRDGDLGAGRDEHDGVHTLRAVLVDDVGALGDPLVTDALKNGNVLARRHKACRSFGVEKHLNERVRRLGRIGGTERDNPGNHAQSGEMFDGLMGRTVFADVETVVGENEHRRKLHERSETDRGAAIVAKDEERRAVASEATERGNAVGDRGHRELADSIADIAAFERAGADIGKALQLRLVAGAEVGGAADKLRYNV